MTPLVRVRAPARRDLIEHFAYLAENVGLDIADRFLTAAEATFSYLAHRPLIGAPLALRNPALAAMRKWRVKGFKDVLIFYTPNDRGVTVVRVQHTAQDWWKLLGLTN